MTSGFKKPGILRASFDYQDLAAIELLIGFYRQPDVYQWIELDSDDPDYASIDDLVACRQDGRFEITQVKFTVDPDNPANRLNWDWLLKRKPGQRSLLQKWAATVSRHANADALEFAELFTDRRPDGIFAAALDKNRIAPDRLSAELAEHIVDQLGSAADMALFFEHFRFRHSQPHLADLEYDLQTRLIPSDTDYAGWITLVGAVKEWATFKQRPEPDGRVRHGHIRAVISRDRPRPLRQNFDVPPGYRPPAATFDASFQDHILSNDGVSVLWGSPGRGKSTYLSHCFQQLEAAGQICIRHHYFLSLSERGTSRFFFQEIERSLIRQIEERLPDLPIPGQSLDRWLDAAAAHVGATGRRLIVMIDGLDHVWREGRSLDHMQQVFAHLLPSRPHMHLVVGTQKIAPKHLPHRLLQYCPEEGWHALPLMSIEAVGHWLDVQYQAGRLALEPEEDARKTLRTLAGAFHRITDGLPLQLIYAFATLTRPGGPVTEAVVVMLPAEPTGDIRDYYRGLWLRVSAGARAILHGLASIEFAIAPGGLHSCFQSIAGAAEAIEEIDHLLDHRETGSYPFHGSIFVFVREQADHEAIAASLRPTILAWLDRHAPGYWKWAWTWITQARFGEPAPLLDGPDRAWTLAALVAGHPPQQIEHILQEAEVLAFDALNFARATELRALWIRTDNAPEFQTQRFAGFVEATLRHGDNDYRLVQLRSTLSEQSPEVMIALLRALAPEAAEVAAERVFEELNRRADEARLEEHSNVDWPAMLVRVLPYLASFDPRRLKTYARRLNRSDTLIAIAIEEATIAERYSKALMLAGLHRGPESDAALFALLCLDGADPRHQMGLRGHAAQPLFHVLYAVRGWPLPRRRPLTINVFEFMPRKRDYDAHPQTGPRLHRFFFHVLSAALRGRVQRVRLVGIDTIEDDWTRQLMRSMAAAAFGIAECLDQGRPLPTLAQFFEALTIPHQRSRSFDAQSAAIGVRLGLRDIAVDLQLLRRLSDPAARIEAADLPADDRLRWHDQLWLEHFANRRLPLHSSEGADQLLGRITAQLDGAVSEFMERADLSINAALFALDHGLAEQSNAFLARSARCLLGYGWRKDTSAFELLAALELMARVDPAWVSTQLLRLAPAFAAITDYTDGDETNHAKAEFHAAFAKRLPDRAGGLYGALVRADEWYYSERLLTDIAKTLDPRDKHDRALLATFLQPDELEEVRALAEKHGAGSAPVLTELHRLIGYSRPNATKDRGSDTTFSDRIPTSAPRPLDYPPPALVEYRAAVRGAKGFGWKDRAIERWLRYWRRNDKGHEALAALSELVAEIDSAHEIDKAYDLAFAASLELEGRQAAFPWLVAAQRYRYGWQRWYTSSAEAERRLALAARHYRDRWAEFIAKSAVPAIARPGGRSSIVLGHSRLIDFLLKVGEIDRAHALAETMIATMIAEVEEQPLAIPEWAQ